MAIQRVLVIDDDANHGRSICDLLATDDLAVESVAEGKLGLSRLEEKQFDVLILDLNIPDMSGIEILKQLLPTDNRVKTIVISGESEVQSVTPVLRLGAYDYLSKPYEPEQLISSVRNAITRQRLESDNERMLLEQEDSRKRHEFLVNASPDLALAANRAQKDPNSKKRVRQVFKPLKGGTIIIKDEEE